MTDWFDVIFEPSRVYADINAARYDEFGAATLLLDGELQHYLHLSERSSWPSYDEARSPQRGYELPSALLLQLLGDPSPELYESIVGDERNPAAERALAVALLSSLYADAERLDDAADVLQRSVEGSAFSDLDLAYVHVHLGLRQIELGRWEDAVASCENAQVILRQGRSHRSLRSALRNISLSNESAAQQLGFGRFDLSARRGVDRNHLDRIDQLTVGGLERDLDRGFKARFASARASSVQFGGGDEVEQHLWGALLRSETLADYYAINRARKNLGRYVLASAAGVGERSPDSGFVLLLRGRDDEGLAQAAHGYVERGPIGVVARVGNAVATSEWGPLEVVPSLKLLEETADVLAPNTVAPLLARLCGTYQRLIRPTALSWNVSTVLDTIAAVARVAEPSTQTIATRFALDLATASEDALTIQSLRRLVYVIDWSSQPASDVDRWVEFIRTSLGAGNDAQMLAEAAFLNLLSIRREELVRIARSVTPGGTSVALSALQTSSAEDLSDEEAEAAALSLLAAMSDIRESAAKGSYGFGRAYDPATVLALLLLRRTELTYWLDLVDFLSDRRVRRSDKATALRVMVDNLDSVPEEAKEAVRQRFEDITATADFVLFPDEPAEFESTRLRVASALALMTPRSILHEIMVFASSGSALLRMQAARAAGYVEYADDVAGLSIVLLLSRDSDPDVRSAACRALLRRTWGESDDDEALVWPRVVELLSEGGREPTLGVVLGLLEGVDGGVEPPLGIKSRVILLAEEHPSWSVRTMASRLAQGWN